MAGEPGGRRKAREEDSLNENIHKDKNSKLRLALLHLRLSNINNHALQASYPDMKVVCNFGSFFAQNLLGQVWERSDDICFQTEVKVLALESMLCIVICRLIVMGLHCRYINPLGISWHPDAKDYLVCLDEMHGAVTKCQHMTSWELKFPCTEKD